MNGGVISGGDVEKRETLRYWCGFAAALGMRRRQIMLALGNNNLWRVISAFKTILHLKLISVRFGTVNLLSVTNAIDSASFEN